MRYYWEALKHFMTANSRHGTHSPFVYALADNVIYTKAQDLLHTTLLPNDFSHPYRNLLTQLLSFIGLSRMESYSTDARSPAVWVDLDQVRPNDVIALVKKGILVIVHEPYRSKKVWRTLVSDPAIIVSLDLFHFGVLMYRDGQRKENFRLRYPYWR